MKWLQGTWAGVDSLMPHIKTKELPFLLTRYSGQHFGRIMSEYVIACIVNHERDFKIIHENQSKSFWTKEGRIGTYRTIADLNIGIMGIGNIGSKSIVTKSALKRCMKIFCYCSWEFFVHSWW